MTRYDVLPAAQSALLPRLERAKDIGYVLYGGTAVALHLGHRQSIDFDFFTAKPLDEAELLDALPILRNAISLQRAPETWTVLVTAGRQDERPVKLSFFGNLGFGRVGTPMPTSRMELLLASPLDLLGHKFKVLLQRVEAKDYRDIAALLRFGLKIEEGLGAACALFGSLFPPADAVRALTYFQGGDLDSLAPSDRQVLVKAAKHAGPIVPARVQSRDLAA